MTKTELKITDMSHPRCIKTAADVLTTPKSIQRTKVKRRKVESLSLSFISSILIAFFSIVGCSDMPYTGSVMTTDDIDEYIVSPNEELICLQNGTDSECLTLIPKNTEKVDNIINGPIIHIHPERLVYVFYHEGKEIVRAEKVMDTTEIVETLTETKTDPLPHIDDPPDDTGTVDDDSADDNTPDDTQQPDPPQQQPVIQQPITQQPVIQQPITQQPDPPQQQPVTQQPIIQQPIIQQPIIQQPPQTTHQPGGTGTTGNNPNANNNPDNTNTAGNDPADDNTRNEPPPPPPPLPPPPPPLPPPPPPPPPSPQTTNQPRSSNNQNGSDNNAPDPPPGPRYPTPGAMYSDHDSGWNLTIYYPDNYTGPRTTDDFGFSISSRNGQIGNKRVRNSGVRFHIAIGAGMLHVNVVWNTDPGYWAGDPPSQAYLIQADYGGIHRISVKQY